MILVEKPGTAPGAVCLQGRPAPLCHPLDRAGFAPAASAGRSQRQMSYRPLIGGATGTRTPRLRHAMATLSRMSYCPVVPGVGFEPTSPRLQRGAFTRLAFQANLERKAGTDPAASTLARSRSAIELLPLGGCGTESNLHSTEAPGYSRPGFPVPYTPESDCGPGGRTPRGASAARHPRALPVHPRSARIGGEPRS